LIGFLIVGVFLGLEKRLNLSGLGAIVSFLGVGFLGYGGLLFHLDRNSEGSALGSPLLSFHLVTSVLGLVLLGLTFVVGIGILVKEFLLKKHRFPVMLQNLPSLSRLENMSVLATMTGFWLMLVGVISGGVAARQLGLEDLVYNPKVALSVLSLGVYVVLILARKFWGLRGRRAAWLTVAGFCSLLLAFVAVGRGFSVY
jgi:ABC-type uncharacterized transport system permease subunit